MDVRVQGDVAAVPERAGRRAGGDVFHEFALAFDEIGEIPDGGRRRKNRDGAVRAVQEQRLAGDRADRDVAEARDGRNAHGAGEKRDMARRRTAVRRKTENQIARQAHGLGRRQVVRHDDRRCLQLARRIFGKSGQGLEQPPLNVVQVAHALAEIGIVHLLELLPRVARRPPHGGFGIDAVLSNVLLGLAEEDDVLEQHLMTLEDLDVLALRMFLQCGNQLLKIVLGFGDRTLETQELVRLAPGLDDILGHGDLSVPAVDERGTDGEPPGRRQSRNRPHFPLIAHPECRTCAPRGPRARPGLPSPGDRRP